MNLPNLLTLSRIFLVPLLVAALLADPSGEGWRKLIPASREVFALAVFLAIERFGPHSLQTPGASAVRHFTPMMRALEQRIWLWSAS